MTKSHGADDQQVQGKGATGSQAKLTRTEQGGLRATQDKKRSNKRTLEVKRRASVMTRRRLNSRACRPEAFHNLRALSATLRNTDLAQRAERRCFALSPSWLCPLASRVLMVSPGWLILNDLKLCQQFPDAADYPLHRPPPRPSPCAFGWKKQPAEPTAIRGVPRSVSPRDTSFRNLPSCKARSAPRLRSKSEAGILFPTRSEFRLRCAGLAQAWWCGPGAGLARAVNPHRLAPINPAQATGLPPLRAWSCSCSVQETTSSCEGFET